MNNEIRKLIKKTLGNLCCERIVLFGSRARGDFRERNDYDIWVIVKVSLTIKEKMRLTGLLRKELAKNLKAEMDQELIKAYRGTVSLPFEPGENKRIAMKIVDDRGIESPKIGGVK